MMIMTVMGMEKTMMRKTTMEKTTMKRGKVEILRPQANYDINNKPLDMVKYFCGKFEGISPD